MSATTSTPPAPAAPAPEAGRPLRYATLATVVANVGIVLTGAVVRLTTSGLGCPSWPRCSGTSLVPVRNAAHPALNMAIEFGNRLLAFLVLAATVACVVAVLRSRPRRRVPLVLSLALVAGVVVQAVVGGLSVRYELWPGWISAHFLLSVAMIALAYTLYVRVREGDGPVEGTVRREVRLVAVALTVAVVALLAAGTVVTGAGPHAGDAAAARYPFRIDQLAQLHGDLVLVTVGLTVTLLVALRLTGAARTQVRAAVLLLVAELAQGVVGVTQYALGVPAPLVWVHVLGATLTWLATLHVLYATRVRR